MSTSAQLFIDDLPQLGAGAKRYLVDCQWGVSRLVYVPGPDFDLSERHRISIVLMKHEEECQRCNLGRLWREHGDPMLKAAVDQVWETMGLSTVAERRN